MDALKKATSDAGRARGERRSAAITTIHVTGEIGGDDEAAASAASTMADDYDLRHETNGFLAQLAKGLSEENETLLSLIRKTNRSLKHMSGWDKTEDGASSTNSNDGVNAVVMVTNPDDLAADIDAVLSHLRTMLTNPSFVPLEEVVVREEEIFRLRQGWEKMEERWQEAVHLIDGWRQRMAASGQPVDMEDLKMGLRLSPVDNVFKLSTLQEEEEEEEEVQDDFEQRPEENPSPAELLHLVPAPGYEQDDDLDDSDAESSIFHDDVDIDDIPEPNFEILQHSTTDQEASDISETGPLPRPPRITPLEESSTSGNRKPTSFGSRKRSGDYIHQDDDDEEEEDESKPPPPPPHRSQPEQSPQKRLKVSTDGEDDEQKTRPNSNIFTESNSSLDSILLLKPPSESSVSTAPSRATARSTRSEGTSSQPATTRRTRAVAAAQDKKKTEAPSKPLPRQRQTRATAATTSSSARSAPSPQPDTATKPRAAASAPASSSATADEMPPPPRPGRSANNNSPTVQSTPRATKPPPVVDTDATPRAAKQSSPVKSASRLPKPRNAGVLPPPQQSPLSMARIAAKLAASEREADAARVRAKLKAARLGKGNVSNDTRSSLAPSQASTTTTATTASMVSSRGDPTKRDRQASASSSAMTGMSGGSRTNLSLNENGQANVSSLGRKQQDAGKEMGGDNDNDNEDNKTVVSSSPHRPRSKIRVVQPEESDAEAEPVQSKPLPRKRGTAAAALTSSSPAKKTNQKPPPPPRSKRAEKVASRRRSTLNPWELQSLIAGEMVPPTPRVPREHLGE